MEEIISKKRKLSGQEESVIEVSDEDVCLETSSGSADVEIVEPNAKTPQLDTVPSQNSDSNLEFASLNSQSSVEILEEPEHAVDLKQRLLELDDEIRLLKDENEELRSKPCSCQSRCSDPESIMTITFSSTDNYRLYKHQLLRLFDTSLEFSIIEQEADLSINIVKDNDFDPNEWVVVEEDEVKSVEDEVKTLNGRPHKKKKRKSKERSPNTSVDGADLNDLFVLDTTPSLSTKNNLKYESKFCVVNSPAGTDSDKQNEAKPALASCFNCSENHNLRDCPKPKNFMKISAARQKFKLQQNKSLRYHMEDEQRFGHLQPGRISEKLQEALGLQDNQMPEHIYRMRRMGYPPGWFNEILAVQQSELVMFDFEGKGALNQKKTVQDLDPDKVVEYPGFNVPSAKGVKDEHRLYGCPSYSKGQTKTSMLDYVRGMQKKAEDNLESCDMDIDAPASDKEVETITTKKQVEVTDEHPHISPTLTELESKKLELLEQLTEDIDTSQADDKNSSEAVFETIDITGTVEELEATQPEPDSVVEADQEQDGSVASPKQNLVKTSSFGTPILKSASPYCQLPNAENFSKDVSEVINFENLPNSTGKYEQMVGVLEKVRKTLKGLNDQKS